MLFHVTVTGNEMDAEMEQDSFGTTRYCIYPVLCKKNIQYYEEGGGWRRKKKGGGKGKGEIGNCNCFFLKKIYRAFFIHAFLMVQLDTNHYFHNHQFLQIILGVYNQHLWNSGLLRLLP